MNMSIKAWNDEQEAELTRLYLEEEINQGTIDPLTFMENLEIEKVKI